MNKKLIMLRTNSQHSLLMLDKTLHVIKETIRDFNTTLTTINSNEQIIASKFKSLVVTLNNNSYLIQNNEFSIDLLDLALTCDEILSTIHYEVLLIKDQLLFAQQNTVSPSLLQKPVFIQSLKEVQLIQNITSHMNLITKTYLK